MSSPVTVKFKLPPDRHRSLKAKAALSGLTLTAFCRQLALSSLDSEPNAATTAPQPQDSRATTQPQH